MDKLEFTDTLCWQVTIQHIRRYRLQLMDELRNCPLEQVERIRGQMDSLDWVEALPDQIFSKEHKHAS